MGRVPIDRLPRLTQEFLAHWDEVGADKEVGGMKRDDLAAADDAYQKALDDWTTVEQQQRLLASHRDETAEVLFEMLIRYRDGIKGLLGRNSIEAQRLPVVSARGKSKSGPKPPA